MSKHTPGPWELGPVTRSGYRYLNSEAWDEFARVVTRMEYDPCESPSGLANAYLIAAAPELLEACKRAMRYAENVGKAEGCTFDDDGDLPFIKAAIAKAEGRE